MRETGSLLWREVGRRVALARQPQPEGVNGPPLKLLLGELRVVARRGTGRLAPYTASRPQTVMLLPGFGSHPMQLRRMKRALAAAGHRPYQWGMGFNLGPSHKLLAFLQHRLRTLAGRHGGPVALVGHSMGGLFAREIASRQPDQVSRVITLGTPFSGDRRANNAWRAYQLITGHPVDQPPIDADFSAKPPVPTIALWSPRDGMIAPRSACGWPGERDRAVAMRCNHLDFPGNADVIAEVLRQLDWREPAGFS